VFEASESLTVDDTDSLSDVYRHSGNTTTLISAGTASFAGFGGASDDGQRVLFETADSLDPAADLDTATDVYEYFEGTTTFVSTGPEDTVADTDTSVWVGDSADATAVVFTTENSLTAADTDLISDIYRRSGGTTTLVSESTAQEPSFTGGSDDASTLFFETDEPLDAADTDAFTDVYRWTAAGLALISTDVAGAPAFHVGNSSDGSRVFFETTAAAVAGDTDGAALDVFESFNGTISQISTQSAAGPAVPATFAAASDDGTRVFFHTRETVTDEDADGGFLDLYERAGGNTTLVSAGGNGPSDAFLGGTFDDGSGAFFETDERISPADTNLETDVYRRAAGATTLVSAGSAEHPAFFSGASADGSRAFYETEQNVCAGDTDVSWDVYENNQGVTSLVSAGGNGPEPAEFLDSSDDGGRVFLGTSESLTSSDGDGGFFDVYAAFIDPSALSAPCTPPPPASSGTSTRPARPRATPRPRVRRVTARLFAPKTQRVLRQGGLIVTAFCDRACTATATTRITLPGASKVLRLRKATRRLRAGVRTRMKVKLTRKARRQLKRALRGKRRLRATVRLDVRDALGSSGLASLSIRLRR
jgi:hypothetical protein